MKKIKVFQNVAAIEQSRQDLQATADAWQRIVDEFAGLDLKNPLTIDDLKAVQSAFIETQNPEKSIKELLLRKIEIAAPTFGKLHVNKRSQLELLDLSVAAPMVDILKLNGGNMVAFFEFFNFENGQVSISDELFNERIIESRTIYAETKDQQELVSLMQNLVKAVVNLDSFTSKFGIDILYKGQWGWMDLEVHELIERNEDTTTINQSFYKRIVDRIPKQTPVKD
jgi:hypothetical protein